MSRLARARQALSEVVRDDRQGYVRKNGVDRAGWGACAHRRASMRGHLPSGPTVRHDKEQCLLPNLFARKPLDKRRQRGGFGIGTASQSMVEPLARAMRSRRRTADVGTSEVSATNTSIVCSR
jgi:hypothetical protein